MDKKKMLKAGLLTLALGTLLTIKPAVTHADGSDGSDWTDYDDNGCYTDDRGYYVDENGNICTSPYYQGGGGGGGYGFTSDPYPRPKKTCTTMQPYGSRSVPNPEYNCMAVCQSADIVDWCANCNNNIPPGGLAPGQLTCQCNNICNCTFCK